MKTTLLLGTALAGLTLGGIAHAQDATIHYYTPVIQSGQPVPAAQPVIKPVPVYTPVPVAAEAGAPAPVTPATIDDMDYLGAPQVQNSQYDADVQFVSGGIGAYEKEWFDSNAKDFNLKATYSDTTGHHLAGVNVTLVDKSGETVLSTTTEGPYLLVKAKPGTYTLNSTYQGTTQTKKLTLGKGTARTSMSFADLES
ncbi:MAG: hypothetical protein DI582_02940 [Azospirillum brasilense]|nr:MAG: hypothetical protein DI582_02940 [Azospirillum brasilense]